MSAGGQHELDLPAFERSARRRDGFEDARAVGSIKFPRGVSRETWFVDLELPAGRRRVVVRRDLPMGSVTPTTLRSEYEVYHRLSDSDVPVAQALWWEDDPAYFVDGREFYVREHVEGNWEIPHLTDPDPAYDALRIESSKEHARKLALIHTCDWESLGFGEVMDVPPDPVASPLTMMDRIVRLLETFQTEPFPAMTEAIEVLRDEAPDVVSRISLLKGTNGIGEEVWRDGRIVALSDWELACLGDPASDFAHLQRLKPHIVAADGSVLWSFQHLLDYYEEVSGIHVEPASVEYYKRLSAIETVLYGHFAGLPVSDGSDPLVRRSWVATEVLFEAVQRLAKTAGIL